MHPLRWGVLASRFLQGRYRGLRVRIIFMTTDRIKTLDAGIAADVAPFLKTEGFTYDRKRRTFMKEAFGCTQIIHFQVGVRSLEGSFSVNLGIYRPIYRANSSAIAPKVPEECHCLIRERLSVLRDALLTTFFRSRLAQTDTPLAWWLTTPTDQWWRFSGCPKETQRSLRVVQDLLRTKGLAWLNMKTSVATLREMHEKRSHHATKI